MDSTRKCFPNGARASYANEEVKTFDMEDRMAETYRRWSDLDQVPCSVSNLFESSPEISPEYYNHQLDLLIDISVPVFLSNVSENYKPEDSIYFAEILSMSMNDCYKYKERVNFVIAHARTQYSVLDNSDYIKGYLRLLKKQIYAIAYSMSQQTVASLRAIAVTRNNSAAGTISMRDKMCKFCRSTGHIQRYCPILNNSGNKFEEH